MLDSILKKVIEVKYNPTISEMNFQLENDWLTLKTIIVDIFWFNIDRNKTILPFGSEEFISL